MAAKKSTSSGRGSSRSAEPRKGAGPGKGRGGEKAINKASRNAAATGKGSTVPPKGPRGG